MSKMNIEGVDFSCEMLSELQDIQDPDIARMTLENIDSVIGYILDPASTATDSNRLEMVTTLHNLSKFIKVLSRKENSDEKKERSY